MADDGEEDEEEGEDGEGEEVEDMAKATFKGHSDAVYCVAVNPKVPSQVFYRGFAHRPRHLRVGVYR